MESPMLADCLDPRAYPPVLSNPSSIRTARTAAIGGRTSHPYGCHGVLSILRMLGFGTERLHLIMALLS
jgi:hypothetical protein